MIRQLTITVDVGTTNSKVSLFEITTGELIDRETFQTKKKIDDFGELFDLEFICESISHILLRFISHNTGNIDSINISSVGESGVLINGEGAIMTPLIAWYDKRASSYVENLSEKQREKIYKVTGLPAHSNYSLPKIKWLVDHYQLSHNEGLTWLNIPDLLCYFLTGEIKTEYSMASRTLCYDLGRKEWSSELLEMFGLENIICFPEVVSSGDVVGYVNLESLRDECISVRIAGHDHMVGALGIGLKSNELLNSTGTTEGLLVIGHKDFNEPKNYQSSLSNGIFTDSNYYTLFSSMPTGGSAFAWYQELFGKTKTIFSNECDELYESYIKNDKTLTEPLIFIPHLSGSGAPFKNSESKGLLYGLTTNTKSKDILLGIVLGLVLEMKNMANQFPLGSIDRLIIIGPAINNPLWLQMKADSLNKELRVIKMDEAVSFGALKSAYPNFSTEVVYETYVPNKNRVIEINSLFTKYLKMYQEKKEWT